MVIKRVLNAYLQSYAGLSRDVWMLSLVMLINRSGAMVVPFLAVYLTQELGFTKFETGIAMSFFGIGSVIGSLGGGYLSDRFSYYNVQFWSLTLTGVGFLLIRQVESYPVFCGAVLALSIVAESFRPANQVAILVYAHPNNLTRSLSLNRMALNLGFSIGPAVGGWLAYRLGFDALFLVDALTCWAAAVLLRVLLVPKKEKHLDTPAEGQELPDKFAAFKDRTYLVFLFLVMLTGVAFMQFFYVVPVYLQEVFLFNEATIGTLLALNGLIIVFVEMPLVKRLEGRLKKVALIQIGTLFIGLSYLTYSIFGLWVLAPWLSIFLVTIGEIFSLPFANAIAQQRSSPGNRGGYMALYSTSFSLAHIIAPALGLQIAGHFGYPAVWGVLVCIAVGTLIGYQFMHKAIEVKPIKYQV